MKSIRLSDGIGLGVCIALSGVVCLFGFLPILHQQEELLQMRSHLQQKRQETRDLSQSLIAMRRKYSKSQRAVQTDALRLEGVNRLNHRINRITQLATNCGLQIDQIGPGGATSTPHYVRVPIDMSGRGGYQATGAFLHQLHEDLADIEVASFDLTGRPARAHHPAVFRMQLSWYADATP